MNKKTTIKQTILCYIPAFLFRFEQFTFISGNVCRGVKLTTHLHLVLRSRMRGAIIPLPQCVFMAWYLVKHRDNFTVTFTFTFTFSCKYTE